MKSDGGYIFQLSNELFFFYRDFYLQKWGESTWKHQE